MKTIDDKSHSAMTFQYARPLSPMACGVIRSTRVLPSNHKSASGTKAFTLK